MNNKANYRSWQTSNIDLKDFNRIFEDFWERMIRKSNLGSTGTHTEFLLEPEH
jgi:hypothetical protein